MRFRKPRHLTWRELGRRFWVELQEDAVTECAAQLAFYFLFALFPFLFFFVTLAAYLPFAPGAVDAMVERLGPLMPPEALLLRRMENLLFSVLCDLRAAADWRAIGDELRAGLEPRTELGVEHAAWRDGARAAA